MSTELESERRLVAYLNGWKTGAAGGWVASTELSNEYSEGVADGRRAKELAVAWGMVKFSARLEPMREGGV